MRQLLSTKDGVKINLLDPMLSKELYPLAHCWVACFPLDGDGMTITSGYEGAPTDGVHKPDSLHYKRRAIDIRVKDVDVDRARTTYVTLAKVLLGPDFDVVWEGNHIHIEYDPKS